MREVQLQSLVCGAIKGTGGTACKLSHRFLVGVCDLLIKLPNYPVMLMEVKLDKRTHMLDGPSLRPGVTMLQYLFLKEFGAAGALCGVMSFVEANKLELGGTPNRGGLWLQIVPISKYYPGNKLDIAGYCPVGKSGSSPVFNLAIVDLLERFANETAQSNETAR